MGTSRMMVASCFERSACSLLASTFFPQFYRSLSDLKSNEIFQCCKFSDQFFLAPTHRMPGIPGYLSAGVTQIRGFGWPAPAVLDPNFSHPSLVPKYNPLIPEFAVYNDQGPFTDEFPKSYLTSSYTWEIPFFSAFCQVFDNVIGFGIHPGIRIGM